MGIYCSPCALFCASDLEGLNMYGNINHVYVKRYLASGQRGLSRGLDEDRLVGVLGLMESWWNLMGEISY